MKKNLFKFRCLCVFIFNISSNEISPHPHKYLQLQSNFKVYTWLGAEKSVYLLYVFPNIVEKFCNLLWKVLLFILLLELLVCVFWIHFRKLFLFMSWVCLLMNLGDIKSMCIFQLYFSHCLFLIKQYSSSPSTNHYKI